MGLAVVQRDIPERIADNEESDIDCVCVLENVVAGRLDHFAVCNDDFATIERLLLPWQLAPVLALAHAHI
jgi:hypothetical protein